MDTLLEIIKQKNIRLDTIPDILKSPIEKAQKQIFDRIIELLSRMKIKDGIIEMSHENLLISSQIDNELKRVFNGSEYQRAVNEFINEFDTQKIINNKYFEKAFPDVLNKSAIANQLVRNAQANTFELLTGGAINSNIIAPIANQLDQAIASGASLKDTIENIRAIALGNEDTPGSLSKYSTQIAFDSFAVSDRAYTNALAEGVDAEWYMYSGGEIATTRCFCEERDGNFYHFKEIEAWGRGEDIGDCDLGDGTWGGENPTTNEATIFLLAGGYNCRHSIQPVSIAIVPDFVVQRNVSNGNYIE